MANEENLILFTSDQSREEAQKNGRKGGIASGAARRAKRDARETARRILSYKPDLPKKTLDQMRRLGMSGRISPDMREIATLAIMQKAMMGNKDCYEFLVKLAGETAESAMQEAKAEEIARRNGAEEARAEDSMTSGDVQRMMSKMSDEQLEQYDQLCAMFEAEAEDDIE